MGTNRQLSSFFDGCPGERNVNRHLVTIKVSVESGAHQRMNLYSTAINEYRLKSLNAEAVQGRCPVKPYRSLLGNFLQYVIYLRLGSLYQAPGTLNVRGKALCHQAMHHKRFK